MELKLMIPAAFYQRVNHFFLKKRKDIRNVDISFSIKGNLYFNQPFGLGDASATSVEISHAACAAGLQPAEGALPSSDEPGSANSTRDAAQPVATPGDSPDPSNLAQEVLEGGRIVVGDNQTLSTRLMPTRDAFCSALTLVR